MTSPFIASAWEVNYNLGAMILYHGSNISIDSIDLARCNKYKDFGQAFYLTTDPEQAMEVAKARAELFGGEPVINTYEFNEALLSDGTLPSNPSHRTPMSGPNSSLPIVMRPECRHTCTASM